MRPPRHIDVTPENININEEYQGYKKGEAFTTFASITFDEQKNPIIFGKRYLTDEEKKGITTYFRYSTWKEDKEWYDNNIDLSLGLNKINLIGLHTDLYDIGDGCHEMWNGWIAADWKEQLMNLIDEQFTIVGIAPLTNPVRNFRNPVAVVCEMIDTGERFWCHSEKEWIEDMREESKEYYKQILEEEK